jgi:hypothetical protein
VERKRILVREGVDGKSWTRCTILRGEGSHIGFKHFAARTLVPATLSGPIFHTVDAGASTFLLVVSEERETILEDPVQYWRTRMCSWTPPSCVRDISSPTYPTICSILSSNRATQCFGWVNGNEEVVNGNGTSPAGIAEVTAQEARDYVMRSRAAYRVEVHSLEVSGWRRGTMRMIRLNSIWSLARTEIAVSLLCLSCLDIADPSRRRSIPLPVQAFREFLHIDPCSSDKTPEGGYNVVLHEIASSSLANGEGIIGIPHHHFKLLSEETSVASVGFYRESFSARDVST